MQPDSPQGSALNTFGPGQDTSSEAFEADRGTRDARAQFAEVKDRITEQARGSIRRAKDSAASSLTDSRRQAADQVGGVATALRRTSEHLRSDNYGSIADFTESLSRHADQAASYIRDSDLAKMKQDVEGFAKRRPGVVLGATFAAGLLLARFLRSGGRDA